MGRGSSLPYDLPWQIRNETLPVYSAHTKLRGDCILLLDNIEYRYYNKLTNIDTR